MTRAAANDDQPAAPAARAMTLFDRVTGELRITLRVDLSAALAALERQEQVSEGNEPR
jgi:hypothetical protein